MFKNFLAVATYTLVMTSLMAGVAKAYYNKGYNDGKLRAVLECTKVVTDTLIAKEDKKNTETKTES